MARLTRPYTAAMLVPTGVGAEIGGYAGDATPAANLLGAACDRLIVHPNVVNAASLYGASDRLRYVEGGMLDRFFLGRLALRSVRANRVGLLVDRRIVDTDPEGLTHLLTAADAVRAVHGVAMTEWSPTREPVASRIVLGAGGASGGELMDPDSLVRDARELVARGAEAIAVVTRMPELPPAAEAAYMAGDGPDPIGGLEAVISRSVGEALGVPVAHAPYEPMEGAIAVDPRLAAEQTGQTFLPCILLGLSRAPRPVSVEEAGPYDLRIEDVDAVVVPWGACGGPSVLAAARRGIPLVVVKGNGVASGVDPETLGLTGWHAVSNYLEAAGWLLAHRSGIDPSTIQRPLSGLRTVDARLPIQR